MISILFCFWLALFFGLVFLAISYLSSSSFNSPFKSSSVESGFGAFFHPTEFNTYFYSLLVVFVFFDLELVLLLSVTFTSPSFFFVWLYGFLFLTLFLEWYWGKLIWLS